MRASIEESNTSSTEHRTITDGHIDAGALHSLHIDDRFILDPHVN